jgi:hypothetical protein
LWNYELITYTTEETSATEPCIVGVYSEDGKGIAAVEEFYAVSSSNTIAPT